MTITIDSQPRPDQDPARDPDYDELWDLAGKLSALLDTTVAAGVTVVGDVHFNRREQVILAKVDQSEPTRA